MSALGEPLGMTYRLTKRHAAYTPGRPEPICPECWSRPDLKVGRGRDGWGITIVGDVPVNDTPRMLTQMIYACSNPRCKTAIVVQSCLALNPIWLPQLVHGLQLKGREAKRFEEGHYEGEVWCDGEIKVVAPAKRTVKDAAVKGRITKAQARKAVQAVAKKGKANGRPKGHHSRKAAR